MKKRLLALLLALLMLGGVACSTTDPEETKNPSQSQQPNEPDTDESGETRLDSGLEMRTFDGLTYRVSSYTPNTKHIYDETGYGDNPVDKASYDRAQYVMETYDMKFDTSFILKDYEAHNKTISEMMKTNDDLYELIFGHVVATCNMAVAGYYYDWYEVPYADPSQPWWPQQTVEQMTVYEKMFTVSTTITQEPLIYAAVMFINKDLLASYNKELPYEWIRQGTWTLDKLISETKDVWTDVGGDGQKSLDDIYGYSTPPNEPGILCALDAPILVRAEDGGYTFGVNSEKMVSVIEKLHQFYFEESGVFQSSVWDSAGEAKDIVFFGNGHALYGFGQLHNAIEILQPNPDITYGIIPQPKYDEAQSSYYTFTEPDLLSIPMTCQNIEFAGYIFELMSYMGYYDVYPVYLSSSLKGQLSDAPDDAEMLQRIQDTLTVQFSYCYDNWQGYGFFFNLLGWTNGATNPSKNVAFYAKTNKNSATARLEKVLTAFKGEFSE